MTSAVPRVVLTAETICYLQQTDLAVASAGTYLSLEAYVATPLAAYGQPILDSGFRHNDRAKTLAQSNRAAIPSNVLSKSGTAPVSRSPEA